MEIDFRNKSNFEPVIVHVCLIEPIISKFYFHKSIISNYPKILLNIVNNTWEITGVHPGIVNMFLADLYRSHTKSLDFKLIKCEDLLDLYNLSIKYDVIDLVVYYRDLFQNLELNPDTFKLLVANGFADHIPTIYLNTDHKNITNALTKLITTEMWSIIMQSRRLNTLESYCNYTLKFVNEEVSINRILDIYCKTRHICSNDLKWACNINDQVSFLKGEYIMRYLLKKISEMNIPFDKLGPLDIDGVNQDRKRIRIE